MSFPSTGTAHRATVSEESVSTGRGGFRRLSDTDTDPLEGRFAAIKAINGNVTLAAGVETARGDTLAAGDVIPNGDIWFGPFTTIPAPTEGTLLAYIYPEEADR